MRRSDMPYFQTSSADLITLITAGDEDALTEGGLRSNAKVRAAVASATSSSQSTAATTKATAKPKRLTKAQKAEQEALASIKAAGTEAFTAAKNTSGLKAGFEAQAKFYRDLNALVAA